MSLRRRLILLVLLAAGLLVAALVAVTQLRARAHADEDARARSNADRIVDDLVAWRSTGAAFDERARLLRRGPLAAIDDGSAGLCAVDGRLIDVVTVGHPRPGGHAPPPGSLADGLLPLDRDAVVAACRAQQPGQRAHRTVQAPRDALTIVVEGVDDGVAAWALVRVARTRAGASWWLVFGVGAALLLVVTVLALRAVQGLRRGVETLQRSFETLAVDLSSPVPDPESADLVGVAQSVRAMAGRLRAAQLRERELARQLQHEQRLIGLGRVVAGVAHEVRNPLTGMKLTLDGMRRRSLDAHTAADVATCLDEIARLDAVVGSLLLVARKGPLERAPAAHETTDVAAVVDERIAGHGTRVQRRGAAGVVDMPHGDLVRVIDNLLHNALAASPDGGVVIEVGSALGGDAVIVRVVDDGPGVPVEHVEHLFEPFFTLRPGGTGLGLSVSRALVEGVGGTLGYQREGGRTCFIATIPRDRKTMHHQTASVPATSPVDDKT